MPRSRISRLFLVSLVGLGLGTSPSLAGDKKKPAPAKKATKEKPAPKKKVPVVSAENKKKLVANVMGQFKFGMTKDEVLKTLEKEINERYEEKIKATTDVAAQDRIRKDRKGELARIKSTFVSFELNKPSPWDVSIIEGEFAHGTNEAMMERWENTSGKNNRRFFFFYDSKLWKMLISLDVSILPEDKKNFETFQGVMQGQYGNGLVEGDRITWSAGDFEVRAIDKLRAYDALALVIEDPRVRESVLALRKEKAPPPKETNAVIKAVIDKDNTDKPDVKSNSGAVDAVIKAQGTGTTTPKKP